MAAPVPTPIAPETRARPGSVLTEMLRWVPPVDGRRGSMEAVPVLWGIELAPVAPAPPSVPPPPPVPTLLVLLLVEALPVVCSALWSFSLFVVNNSSNTNRRRCTSNKLSHKKSPVISARSKHNATSEEIGNGAFVTSAGTGMSLVM